MTLVLKQLSLPPSETCNASERPGRLIEFFSHLKYNYVLPLPNHKQTETKTYSAWKDDKGFFLNQTLGSNPQFEVLVKGNINDTNDPPQEVTIMQNYETPDKDKPNTTVNLNTKVSLYAKYDFRSNDTVRLRREAIITPSNIGQNVLQEIFPELKAETEKNPNKHFSFSVRNDGGITRWYIVQTLTDMKLAAEIDTLSVEELLQRFACMGIAMPQISFTDKSLVAKNQDGTINTLDHTIPTESEMIERIEGQHPMFQMK